VFHACSEPTMKQMFIWHIQRLNVKNLWSHRTAGTVEWGNGQFALSGKQVQGKFLFDTTNKKACFPEAGFGNIFR